MVGKDSDSNHLGRTVHTQLASCVGSMLFDGLHTDLKFLSDALVGKAAGHELNDLQFAT